MFNDSSKSYLNVQYDLRPSKQVERRMFLDFFRRIASFGVSVEEFRYTGMGSIHFVDHILFHKFLGIGKLVSVERDEDIEQRIKFNRPFECVEIQMMEISEYLPTLSSEERHIVWLDYDNRLSRAILDDVRSCARLLSVGSFVFVTVDAEPPKHSSGPADNFSRYKKLSGDLWAPGWSVRDFETGKLQHRSLDLLGRAFREGVAGRPNVNTLPCFSFTYADGHRMATMGIQLGRDEERLDLEKVKVQGAEYLVLEFGGAPFCIDVPVLTRRERSLLESVMPSNDFTKAQITGIDERNFENFASVYRFLPTYAELLLG